MAMEMQTIIEGQGRLLRGFVPTEVADHNAILEEEHRILSPYDSGAVFISGIIGRLELLGYVEINPNPRNRTREDHQGGVYQLTLRYPRDLGEIRDMTPMEELDAGLGDPLVSHVDPATKEVRLPYKRGEGRTYLFCFSQPAETQGEGE